MPAITHNQLRHVNTNNFIDSLKEIQNNYVYLMVGKSTEWDDESSPDSVTSDVENDIKFYNDIIGGKILKSGNSTIVCRRYSWTPSEIWDEYRDDKDLLFGISDINSGSYNRYYVVTDEYNVYKCINNNGNSISINKPTGTNNNIFETADGYNWKFMYTLSSTQRENFLTDEWLPVNTLEVNDASTQWVVQDSAVSGSIENIVISDGGSGYNSSNPPSINISGDGSGATAQVNINNTSGEVTGVNIISAGSDYTYADITITGGVGSNAVAKAVMSPYGGHGKDAVKELGGVFGMINVTLVDNESGNIANDTQYRKIGLIYNPQSINTGKILNIGNLSSFFTVGETIVGDTSSAEGIIVKSDYSNNKVYVQNTFGSFLQSETITGQTSSSTAQVVSVTGTKLPITTESFSGSDLLHGSGDIIYMEHRTKIQRQPGQNEKIQIVII